MQTCGENKGWLEQEAPFSNEIEMVILKLKRIVVLVHQISKLKRLLRDKGAIFYSPLVTFWKRIPDSKKNSFEIGFHTKNCPFLLIFK